MQRTLMIAMIFLGTASAQGQTAPNGQTASGEDNDGIDPLSVPVSSSPTASSSLLGSTSGITIGTAPTITTGSGNGGPGAMSAAGTTSSQAPLLGPGEILDTSTQAASTTAAAPGPPAPVCPPPVPSTDGGSANLSEIAGPSLGGC